MIPEPGLVVGGKYRLSRPLGEGGMGTVWVARHTHLDVDVAVKLMSPALAKTPSAGARFEREAKAAAQLKSPHVVHIHDYGVQDGSPYIAMEMLEGEDLDALLQREKRLSLVRAAEILGQAAKALRAAHDAGIVHRDLKPSNLFLSRPGGELLVKVLDFGIAKETHAEPVVKERTTTGVVLGSPLYMSPEQARGAAVGPASDLWSLAVVAFEMITGTHPFLGASVGDVIAKICGDELPVPSQVEPSLPPAIDDFFERALRRAPARRFGSARELADAFAAVAAAHPDVAPPPLPTQAEDGPSRHAPTLVADAAEPPRLGRTGATAPLVIAVDIVSGEDATEPETASLSDSALGIRETELGPPPAPLPVAPSPRASLPRRIAVGVVAAVILAIAYFVGTRPTTPTTAPEVPLNASRPTPTVEPTAAPSASTTAPTVDVAPAPSTSAPTAGASGTAPRPPASGPRPPPPTEPRPSGSAPVEAPRVPPRPRAAATATSTARVPRTDPFTGLPVQD